MITGYGHFVQLAESLQWDETAIDLTADTEAWPKLEQEESDQVLGLLAGFCIGETSVATHLTSFHGAATTEDRMDQVLQHALTRVPEPIEWDEASALAAKPAAPAAPDDEAPGVVAH